MSSDEVTANQAKLETMLSNQETIISNQDRILKNQEAILAKIGA